MGNNIVIFADGTWQSKETRIRSNIAEMAKLCDKPQSQHVFYQAGVGTTGGIPSDDYIDNSYSGLTGEGINENIKSLYQFLCRHYEPGDDVYLFGFSRGAYTVRSLIGLVEEFGIIKKEKVSRETVNTAFDIYMSNHNGEKQDQANSFWQQYGLNINLNHERPIKFLGVFDTVGSLGWPVPLFEEIGYLNIPSFHHIALNPLVRTARQFLAMDELRYEFQAVLWDAHQEVDSKQLWYPGGHANVGGGAYLEPARAGISIKTMLDMAETAGKEGVQFKPDLWQIYQPHADINGPVYESELTLYPFDKSYRPIGVKNDEALSLATYERNENDPHYLPPNMKAYCDKNGIPYFDPAHQKQEEHDRQCMPCAML